MLLVVVVVVIVVVVIVVVVIVVEVSRQLGKLQQIYLQAVRTNHSFNLSHCREESIYELRVCVNNAYQLINF